MEPEQKHEDDENLYAFARIFWKFPCISRK